MFKNDAIQNRWRRAKLIKNPWVTVCGCPDKTHDSVITKLIQEQPEAARMRNLHGAQRWIFGRVALCSGSDSKWNKIRNNKHNSWYEARRQLNVLLFYFHLIFIFYFLRCVPFQLRGCCIFIWLSLFVSLACSHTAITNAMGNSTCCECRSLLPGCFFSISLSLLPLLISDCERFSLPWEVREIEATSFCYLRYERVFATNVSIM